ncbi:MAG TPA: energy transducer TonB [Allosphingosinicella sp.]|nr:energy transducer TonB [Allosphingosinicella sp.]
MAFLVPVILIAAATQAAAEAPRRAAPIGNPGAWISHEDYPAQAAAMEAQGQVRVTLDIDPQGRPVGCRILAWSGNAALDSATCRLFISRGRFRPAVDAAGRPAPDTFTTAVTWNLPRLEFAPFKPREVVNVLHFTASGFSHCTGSIDGVDIARSDRGGCGQGAFLIGFMEKEKRARRVTFQQVFSPAGQPRPHVSKPEGELASEEIFDVEIASDGTIRECRRKGRRSLIPMIALSGCEPALSHGDRFEPAADPAANRRGTLLLRTYEKRVRGQD